MGQFSHAVKNDALKRAGNRCECTRKTCGHSGRCHRTDNLEAHHVNRNGGNVLSNCQILCHVCHTNTRSYGN